MSISSATRVLVLERAKARCEYCHILDATSLHGFHVDHIISKKHLGSNEVDNLAWSCATCNQHKGTDVASYDSETVELTPFFNPRIDNWHEHFVLEDYRIIGKTPIGRVTVRIFHMNIKRQITARSWIIRAGLW